MKPFAAASPQSFQTADDVFQKYHSTSRQKFFHDTATIIIRRRSEQKITTTCIYFLMKISLSKEFERLSSLRLPPSFE